MDPDEIESTEQQGDDERAALEVELGELAKTRAAEEADLIEARHAVTEQRAKNAEIEAQNRALMEEIARFEARAATAEGKQLDLEIDALIGIKFMPCEREAMTELARTNRVLFHRLMAQRTSMTFLRKIVPADPKPENVVAKDPDGDETSLEDEERWLRELADSETHSN